MSESGTRSVARSVRWPQTPSTEGSGKRCSECHSREVAPNSEPSTGLHPSWRKVPESDARTECEAPVPNSKHWFTVDILPSTTAVFSYAIGSRKLSANEQFSESSSVSSVVGAQAVVSLSQVTNISNKTRRVNKAANKVYTSTNKSTII